MFVTEREVPAVEICTPALDDGIEPDADVEVALALAQAALTSEADFASGRGGADAAESVAFE